MKQKKEHYRNKLPHFQQPGQWYSITCVLFGAMPKKAIAKYSLKLEAAKNNYELLLNQKSGKLKKKLPESEMINSAKSIQKAEKKEDLLIAQKEFYIALRKYRLAYDKILHTSKQPTINLCKKASSNIINEALHFWEGKHIENHAFCIMPNHIHWILTVKKRDNQNKPIYLEDILHSIKLYTAKHINKIENRSGQLWEHESFDTTLRDTDHFYNAMNYILQNPVSAGFVKKWRDWPGTWISKNWEMDFEQEIVNL